MYVFALVTDFVFVDNHSHSNSDFLMAFFPRWYITTVFLIIICYKTGEKPGWRWGKRTRVVNSKVLDVLDPEGNHTGMTADIFDVHHHGHWHRTANVYIVNSKNEVLFQRRSKTHMVFPGMWQFGAGGHILSGQSSLEGVKDETKDELGLDIPDKDFIFIGTSIKKEEHSPRQKFDYEYQDNYLVYKDIELKDMKKQESELSDIAWFPMEEVRAKMEARDPEFVYHASTPLFFAYIDSHGTNKN